MVEILRNKNLATRFQILVEIAANQPNIQQKDIAQRLNVTPQAVSEYIKQLVKDGMLTSDRRSRRRVSAEGVDWIIRQLKELQEYLGSVEKVVSNIKVTAALAACDLSQGQTVGLEMRGGMLLATDDLSSGAQGTAITNAAKGDNIGITNIQGIIPLEIGEVTVLEVPGMQRGGSKNVDFDRLQQAINDKRPVACLGIEAMAALTRLGIQPDCIYAAREAVIEAARSGLSPVMVCIDEEIPTMIKRLEEAGIKHILLDLRLA